MMLRDTLLVACLILTIICLSLFIAPSLAKAATQYVNDSSVARLNVSNYMPHVVGVIVDDATLSPADNIDLVSASTRTVWCNGTVVDLNGRVDIVKVNVTFFHVANRSRQADDRNEHYHNSSCKAYNLNTYNASYSCAIAVWYYANNGTWYCNMSAYDNATGNRGGVSGFNSSLDSTYVNSIYALDVPATLDYGELLLGAVSASDVAHNVTNTGNRLIDLDLYGYGGTAAVSTHTENNLSMRCSLGTINVTQERYSLSSGTAYAGMTSLSGQRLNPNGVTGFDLAQRTSESANSTRTTYWKIGVPSLGVKGRCNGTIVFSAVQDS